MNPEAIFNLIVENTREVVFELEDHDFKMDDSLKELGANSIDRSEIIMMTLEALDKQLPLVEFAKAGNMGELAKLIHERI